MPAQWEEFLLVKQIRDLASPQDSNEDGIDAPSPADMSNSLVSNAFISTMLEALAADNARHANKCKRARMDT